MATKNVKIREAKVAIIEKHQRGAVDTGSPEVQISLWSGRITALTQHFKDHPKDNHSRRGLLTLVQRRRKLLSYLKHTARDRYIGLINTLGLRG